jgi:hypothetical protein
MGLGERRVMAYEVVKVESLFDILEVAISEEDWERAELMLAKISIYYQKLTDFQTDYYNHCQSIVDDCYIDDYPEPSELDEWHSFDPDC